jgi:kinesin family member C2/C3
MEGAGTPETRGMNYRALDCLFRLRDERAVDTSFEVTITLLEIYNEEIRDMLRSPSAEPIKLSVKESKDGMYVPGITEVPVNTSAEVLAIMRQGYKNRTTFATDMNEHSSRSHWCVQFFTWSIVYLSRDSLCFPACCQCTSTASIPSPTCGLRANCT